ncbi:MAG: mandelate racemase/muconate lactonizing enzyme family protein [Geminicoccaceae bacterium]|mgnify:CR=1 FL=1|nr:mandelate racemase/muconate lactonizing enzyme family protein [Geminicoccaceae bacterium]
MSRRIADLRVVLIKAPLEAPIIAPFGRVDVRHNLVVRLKLEGGAEGLGEVWANFPPWGCPERVEILRRVARPALVGETLDDPARLHQMLRARMRGLANQMGAIGPFDQALAGVDIALWDAHSRALGRPLRQVLAEGAADSVAVYATNLPIDRPDMIDAMAAKGHTRFKVKLPADTEMGRRWLPEARAAAGERMLMMDASQGQTPAKLAGIMDALGAAGLAWLEEPFPVDDTEAYREWHGMAGRPPLAMGENSYGESGFEQLLAEIDPDWAQPDITKTAGITRGGRLVAMGKDAGKQVALHMYGGPVGLYASAQLAAALGTVDLVEMDSKPNPLFVNLDRTPEVVEGRLRLPEGPGLGIALDPVVLERFDVTES